MKKPVQNAQQFEVDRLRESIKRKNVKIRNLRAKLMNGVPTKAGTVVKERIRPYSVEVTEPRSNLLEMFGKFVVKEMLGDEGTQRKKKAA